MKKMEPSYQRSMVIVHGLSEQSICSNIKSNLRLPQEIISRDNGRCSIQITSLMPLLNDSRFKDYKSFIRSRTCQKSVKKLPIVYRYGC